MRRELPGPTNLSVPMHRARLLLLGLATAAVAGLRVPVGRRTPPPTLSASSSATRPLALPAHEAFLSDVAMSLMPQALGGVAALLVGRGEEKPVRARERSGQSCKELR